MVSVLTKATERALVPPWQPLRDAAVGEWVEYDTLEGRRLRYEVVEVGATAVRTRVVMQADGKDWGQSATREDTPDVDPLAAEAVRHDAARSVQTESIDAAGQQWSTTLYEDRWTDEEIPYVRRTWVSDDVPFEGVVRMELYGGGQLEARLTLQKFGQRH